MIEYELCISKCSSEVFFFKQKTANEMGISNWSSDGSSDLCELPACRSAILTISVETPPNVQAMASIRSVFAWLVRNGNMHSLSIRYMYRPSAPARLIGLPSSNKGVVRIAKNTLQSENDARISGCRQPLAGHVGGA